MLEAAVLGSVAGLVIYHLLKFLSSKDKAWGVPGGVSSLTSQYPIVTTDPGIAPGSPLGVGVTPCPTNPPPPAGFAYWPASKQVPADVAAWSVATLHVYPIGTFVQDMVGGKPVAARIEYHSWLGRTNQTGCFKGVSLMVQVS